MADEARAAGPSRFACCFAEFLGTFFIVLAAGCDAVVGSPQFGPATMAFVYMAADYSMGDISGGHFNPAVTVALALSGKVRCLDGNLSPAPVCTKLFAESLGTFTIVLTLGLNFVADSKSRALSVGAVLTSMTYALYSCSGAHFNPAVTLSVLLGCRGKITMERAVSYVGAQIAGAILGAYTCRLCFAADIATKMITIPPPSPFYDKVGRPAPGKRLGWGSEMIFTFMLCYVFLCMTAVMRPSTQYFGLMIGLCAAAGLYAAGNICEITMNPAASIGVMFLGPREHSAARAASVRLTGCAVQLLAAVVSSVFFVMTHPSELGFLRASSGKEIDGFDYETWH